MLLTVVHAFLLYISAYDVLALPWEDKESGITIALLDSVLGDGRLSHLVADPRLCQRLQIESVYRNAIDNQEEDAVQIRAEEALVIPDDIDYLE